MKKAPVESLSSMVPKGNRITMHPIFSEPIQPILSKRPALYHESQYSSYSKYTSTVSGNDDQQDHSCYICLCAVDDPATVIRCGHSFCFDCLFTWYKVSETCPVCKSTHASFLRNATHDNNCTNVNVWRSSNESNPENVNLTSSAILNMTIIHRQRFANHRPPADTDPNGTNDQNHKRAKISWCEEYRQHNAMAINFYVKEGHRCIWLCYTCIVKLIFSVYWRSYIDEIELVKWLPSWLHRLLSIKQVTISYECCEGSLSRSLYLAITSHMWCGYLQFSWPNSLICKKRYWSY